MSIVETDQPENPLIGQLSSALARASGQESSNLLREITHRLLRALSQGEISVSVSSIKGFGAVKGDQPAFGNKLIAQGLVAEPGGFAPFILVKKRIYLARYFHYDTLLRQRLNTLAQQAAPDFDQTLMISELNYLFPSDPALINSGMPNWPKVAAALALLKSLCVISGGPGTGKTTTVLRLLAALCTAQTSGEHPLRVRLAAPTGKAAARMQESIRAGIDKLGCDNSVKAQLQELKASTIHRLLGYKHHSVNFKHSATNLLQLDVLVVDESSMIDSAMMAKLLDAVPNTARVLLLGDKDQLSPVEPGSPFADICSQYGFSEEFLGQLTDLSGEQISVSESSGQALADNLVFLQHSYRFGAESGIGQLAKAINESDSERAMSLMNGDEFSDVHWREYDAYQYRRYDATDPDPLVEKITTGFKQYSQTLKVRRSIVEIFKAFQCFCILTATRKGLSGLETVNDIAQQALGFNGENHWFHGKPIMVTRNDYQTNLYNGDVGLCLDMDGTGKLRVYFPTVDGFRDINPSRVPEHETAFALTVHKSQGSEYGEVLFMLPDGESQVLSKELVYTAVTRAKERVDIWGKTTLMCGSQ